MQSQTMQLNQSLQFTNLRAFLSKPISPLHPHIHAPKKPPRNSCNSLSQGGLGVLQNAEVFQPAPVVDDVDTSPVTAQFPPFEEWTNQPDLLQGCEPHLAPLNIAVLLSGGVDSSLALHLLKAAGHNVTGFYLQIWFQEDFRNFWDACPWEEDLTYCRAVCDRLNVPLEVIPLSTQYWDRVVSHSISEIKAGRTPNPDMLCNSRVKFGAFLEYLETHPSLSFDRIASGHYARVDRFPTTTQNEEDSATPTTGLGSDSSITTPLENKKQEDFQEVARLSLTPDAIKDQTYFLAHLTQQQLSQVLFPLGRLTKPEVRALAVAADLPNQSRKDSQGICFLGKVKFSEFVKEHLGEWPGPLIEEESDEVVGYHRGFWFHTLGQRKGIFLSGGPWYVTRKDPDTNTVYVSRQYHEGEVTLRRSTFRCGEFSWSSDLRPDLGQPLQCKVRHGPKLYTCTLTMEKKDHNNNNNNNNKNDIEQGERGFVELDGIDQGLAAGQYAVFYQNGYCLGCAVITG